MWDGGCQGGQGLEAVEVKRSRGRLLGWVYGRSYLTQGCWGWHEVKTVGMRGIGVVTITVEVIMVDRG